MHFSFKTNINLLFDNWLMEETGTKPGDWKFRVAAGQNGVDATWTGKAGGEYPGFEHAELKPATDSGFNTFQRQVDNWQNDGQTRLFGYDQNGNIFDTGRNYTTAGDVGGGCDVEPDVGGGIDVEP